MKQKINTELLQIVKDLEYILSNVWAPDYKWLCEEFIPRCQIAVAQAEGRP